MSSFQFSFANFARNLRRSIRQLRPESQWQRQLRAFLAVLVAKTQSLNWLYKQLFVATSSEQGLIDWGHRLEIERHTQESDEAYRRRLVIEKSIRDSKKINLALKRTIVAELTGLEPEQIQVESIYSSDVGRKTGMMGGPLSQPIMTRRWLLYRYRVRLPKIPDGISRNDLLAALRRVTHAGNWPEIIEEAPP